MGRQAITVRVEKEDVKNLDYLAGVHETNRSDIIRGLLSVIPEAPQGGVWAVVTLKEDVPSNFGSILGVFATEIDALRSLASDGGEGVAFISWGRL